jgi:uncharacterized linocin/CFP29 family protein
MDDRNAQVGWSEAQWNRVREEVLQAWQRVRVAGSFLPIYGPLPPSTQVVPSEVLKSDDGSVDDRATTALVEISLPVRLSRQQIWEEDLSSALLQFRRRATQLGQLEDWYIFNGTYPSEGDFAQQERGLPEYRPEVAYLNALDDDDSKRARISGTPTQIDGLNRDGQLKRMRQRNPGSLGLIEGPRVELKEKYAKQAEQAEEAQQKAEEALGKAEQAQPQPQARSQVLRKARQLVQKTKEQAQEARKVRDEIPRLDNNGLMQAIVAAINSLENNGYVAPYVCVFGRKPFQAAFDPINGSTVLPRDRIEPLIGRELLHASGIDIPPQGSGVSTEEWRSRGVLLSMADEPIDLALAAEATPEFRQVGLDGKYVFSVFERFALRIKDANAIAPLQFQP